MMLYSLTTVKKSADCCSADRPHDSYLLCALLNQQNAESFARELDAMHTEDVTQKEVGGPLIRRLVVQSRAPPVCMFRCLWALSVNVSFLMATDYVNVTRSAKMFEWLKGAL